MTDPVRGKDWVRLAHFVRARRRMLALTQGDLARKAGVGMGTITNLEAGRSRGRVPHNLPLVEVALGWEAGSSARVLDGGLPTELGGPIRVRTVSAASKAEIREQLHLNEVMSAAVKAEMLAWLDTLPERSD